MKLPIRTNVNCKVLRRCVIVLLFVCPMVGSAQDKKIRWGLSFDYQFIRHKSYSVGLGPMNYSRETGKKEGWGIELELVPENDVVAKSIYGFKLNGFLAFKNFLNLGYGLGYFTNYDRYKVVFAPELGVGCKNIFLVYRRNLKIFGNDLNELNKDKFSLDYMSHWIDAGGEWDLKCRI